MERLERDQPVGRVQPIHGQLGPPAVLVAQPGARKELAQAQIPGVRCAEKQQPMGLVAVGIVLYPAVGADDRLHAAFARRAVELHHAEEVRRVGERERRHAIGLGPRHRVFDAHDTVAHRVLAVHSQVNETRRRHVKKFYLQEGSP
jgi:hypothetical protein